MVSQFIHEALLQEDLGGKVRCHTCERRCVLVNGGKGWCRTRRNRRGTLVTTTFGAISSLEVNPIEKKPFFHFQPGSTALTVGSWSCNFSCPWCQNWHISKKVPNVLEYLSPQEFVSHALENGRSGTSISFNELTLSLEWSLDVFRLATSNWLYNTFVTNGYMTSQALELLVDAGLDALNVDIKGDHESVWSYCQGIDVEKVWTLCTLARGLGLHLEITTLVIPGVNDSHAALFAIASRIETELGADIPWHVSAYQPAYLFKAAPTHPGVLQAAHAVGAEAGLYYVYTGNLPAHPYENTYCHRCGALLIHRLPGVVRSIRIMNGCCERCGVSIPGVW